MVGKHPQRGYSWTQPNLDRVTSLHFLCVKRHWDCSCVGPFAFHHQEIRPLCCNRHQVSHVPFTVLVWISLNLIGVTCVLVGAQADVSPAPGDLHFCVLINNRPKIHDAHFTDSPSLCPLIHVPGVYFWHSSFRAAYKPLFFLTSNCERNYCFFFLQTWTSFLYLPSLKCLKTCHGYTMGTGMLGLVVQVCF